MKILLDIFNDVLKTFDEWYNNDYMLYVLIGLVVFFAYMLTKFIMFVAGWIGKIRVPVG